ncbi:MAG: protein kinase [Anaerolineae bacterium]|nr:protein kinase [Anaerolineae bacterium]
MEESTLTGKTIGKYHIEERLGRGGMAEVYKGYQESLDRYVAIKIMHTFLSAEDDFLQRFKREARAMAALGHPNIVRVFDFDIYGKDSYYLVMEYIDGGTLKQKLEELAAAGESFPLEQSVKMIADVADALSYAHRRGMVHRDIKPANIMLRKETGQAVLTDFGIVKLMGSQTMAYTATGALIGTPSYMSPEQALGKPGDERVDIYSLGVLLFQMVTNKLPFAADTPLAVVMKHVNEPVPQPVTFNPDMPLDLQNAIVKALAKNPDERFQTAAEMAAALRAINWSDERATTAVTPLGGATVITSSPDYTAPGMTIASQTAVGAAQTSTVVHTPAEPTAVGAPVAISPETAVAPPARKIPTWAYAVVAVIFLLITGGGLYASGAFDTDDAGNETPPVIAGDDATNTPTPPAIATETPSPVTATPNQVATQLAELAIALTAAAATDTPTNTPTASHTPAASATPSPTVDATAAFLDSCVPTVRLVSTTRANTTSNAVFPSSGFTAQWVLENNSDCPWPVNLVWAYVEGEEFGYEDAPIAVGTAVAPGERVTLTADFASPSTLGTYESTWELQNAEGDGVGTPLTFSFVVVPRQTPTPTASPTSGAPTATPSPTPGAGVANYIFTVESCDYPGNGPDWRCQITIFPYLDGGSGGQFTVFVFDLPGGQAAEYRGPGPFTHFAQARRCAAYNHEIRVIEDTTATQKSGQIYIDPNNYFPGGCTLP